jgi:crossover junction endodeoxyribonuclease RuvC
VIYLGVDPGYARCGFGIIQETSRGLSLLKSGVIETPAGQPFPQRIEAVRIEVTQLIGDYHADYLAVEHPVHGRNVTNSVEVGAAYGAVLLAGIGMATPTLIYWPSQVKAAVAGGRARKAEIQRGVKLILNLDKTPKPDDAADGCAVAICAASRRVIDEAQAGLE